MPSRVDRWTDGSLTVSESLAPCDCLQATGDSHSSLLDPTCLLTLWCSRCLLALFLLEWTYCCFLYVKVSIKVLQRNRTDPMCVYRVGPPAPVYFKN